MQYRRRDSLMRLYERSKRFVDDVLKEMEKSGRYPGDSILRGKGYVLTNEDDFRDYLRWREAIKAGRKVPPYNRPVETPEKIYLRGVETR